MDKFKAIHIREGSYVYGEVETEHALYGDTDSVVLDLSVFHSSDCDIDDVVKTADYIGENLNSSFPEFLTNVFNIDPENTGIIQTAREIVADSMCLYGRKMYAMRVKDDEGSRVNKMEIKGLAIKRTDTPVVVQNFLEETVKMLMDHKTFEYVSEQILKFKDYYHTLGMEDIGRPTGIKSLAEYERRYEEQGHDKAFPYHVRASMFYNSLCGPSDAKIRSGDKIKIIYIHHPDSKYVAIPSDAAVLPDFLNEFDIDWKTQWEKAESKITAFLKPIGYDRQSRQSSKVNELFEF